MTAYTLTSGTYDGIYQTEALNKTQFSRVVDWSKLANGTTAGVNTDTADIIDIPAGFVLTGVAYQSKVACTTTSYFTVSPFLSTSISAAGAAGTITTQVSTSAALIQPVGYLAATAVKLVLSGPAPHNGKGVVTVCGYQMPTV